MVAETHNQARARFESAAYRDYVDIARVAYDAAHESLAVTFANGETAQVKTAALVRPALTPRWERATVARGDDAGAFIRVPVSPGRGDLGSDYTDISGFDVRLLTDAAFAAEMARKEDEAARRVGRRLRELRRARGLTAKAVAERAGLAQQTVTRIELGQHDVTYSVLKRMLAVLGYGLADLHDSANG